MPKVRTILLEAAATGPGNDIPINPRINYASHAVEFAITGAPTAVTIKLEGNITGTAPFFDLATHVVTAEELAAGAGMFHVQDKPVGYVRANITVLTGGTAPTVTVYYRNS